MTYSSRLRNLEPKLAGIEQCLNAAQAASLAISNPATIIADPEGCYTVQGYGNVGDLPPTSNKVKLAEYKVAKLCEGMVDMVRLASWHIMPLDVKKQADRLYRWYLDAYPLITHEFVHQYISRSQVPLNYLSDQLKWMNEAAHSAEDSLIGRKESFTKLFEKEAFPLPREEIVRMVSSFVTRLHHAADP